jgi:putative transposase
MSKRRRFSAKFKSKVALEALKGQRTLSELSQEYGVHSNQIVQWKKKLQDELPDIFSRKRDKDSKSREELENELYRQIGQLKVEIDWLKKKL